MAQDKISIRASKEDIAKLNKIASKLSMTKTALIKKFIKDGFGQTVEVTNPTFLEALEKIQTVLTGIEGKLTPIGNNINQIATKLNSGENLTEKDRKIIEDSLNVIEQADARFHSLSNLISTKNKKIVLKKRGAK
ncbi:plasmid mobilization relaxosome protein MobC [Pseudomonas sp. 50_B]|uniref:plasmid mobilization relaxosome protein MobC n=1 Tax=Pseudomonas sp. 50_B TaxID=2813574 RepID=UPI001A9F0112|nr:plasmid mobilization relaxosome protein MobC [Pseudomonas sp. 50_B]